MSVSAQSKADAAIMLELYPDLNPKRRTLLDPTKKSNDKARGKLAEARAEIARYKQRVEELEEDLVEFNDALITKQAIAEELGEARAETNELREELKRVDEDRQRWKRTCALRDATIRDLRAQLRITPIKTIQKPTSPPPLAPRKPIQQRLPYAPPPPTLTRELFPDPFLSDPTQEAWDPDTLFNPIPAPDLFSDFDLEVSI